MVVLANMKYKKKSILWNCSSSQIRTINVTGKYHPKEAANNMDIKNTNNHYLPAPEVLSKGLEKNSKKPKLKINNKDDNERHELFATNEKE